MVEQLSLPHYRLFILGAGFSKPAGLPLSEKLLDYVRLEVRGRGGILEQEIEDWLNT